MSVNHNGHQFVLDVRRLVKKMQGDADAVVADIAVGLAQRIVERNPVGDPALWSNKPPPGYEGGLSKGNWQLCVDGDEPQVFDTVDPTGEASMSRILEAMPQDAAHHTLNITNALPYMTRLEDGWSSQAPQGMVGLAVVEMDEVVRNAVEKME